MKWRKIGGMKPTAGEELTNDRLSNALSRLDRLSNALVFTPSEWASFGIGDNLRTAHFIQAGAMYFRPAETHHEFTEAEWEDFCVLDLRMGHFIKSGDFYFEPCWPAGPRVGCINALRYLATK